MKSWKTVALSAALLGAVGAGAAITPAAAQSRAPRAEVFSIGGGSRIGISISEVDSGEAKGKAAGGVLIESVDEDSPAAKAGLKKGDVVVEFDGERVRSVRQFTRLVGETPDGRAVSVAVTRDGQRTSLTVTPREGNGFRFFDGDHWDAFDALRRNEAVRPVIPARPATPVRPMPPGAPLAPLLEGFGWRSGNQLGITVGDLSGQLAEYFGTKEGVLVTSVQDDSAAAKAGVKAGDVIVNFNGSSVETPSELRRRMQGISAGEEFTIGIMRDRKPMTLKGKAAESSSRRRTSRTIL